MTSLHHSYPLAALTNLYFGVSLAQYCLQENRNPLPQFLLFVFTKKNLQKYYKKFFAESIHLFTRVLVREMPFSWKQREITGRASKKKTENCNLPLSSWMKTNFWAISSFCSLSNRQSYQRRKSFNSWQGQRYRPSICWSYWFTKLHFNQYSEVIVSLWISTDGDTVCSVSVYLCILQLASQLSGASLGF